jgi:hypothetical protein
MPATYSLVVYRGDSYAWNFILWNDVGKTEPTDLTGVVPKAEIRDQPGGNTIVPLFLTVTLPNTITATLNAAASSQLPTPAGVWDLQLTYQSGAVLTVLAGEVYVTADVTDSSGIPSRSQRVRLIA